MAITGYLNATKVFRQLHSITKSVISGKPHQERTIAMLFLLQSNFIKANIHPQIFLAFISKTFLYFNSGWLASEVWAFHDELILFFVSPVWRTPLTLSSLLNTEIFSYVGIWIFFLFQVSVGRLKSCCEASPFNEAFLSGPNQHPPPSGIITSHNMVIKQNCSILVVISNTSSRSSLRTWIQLFFT